MHNCLARAPLSIQNGAARCAQAGTRAAQRSYVKLRGPWLSTAARACTESIQSQCPVRPSARHPVAARTRCLSDVVSSEKKSSAFRPWPCSCATKSMPLQLGASRVPSSTLEYPGVWIFLDPPARAAAAWNGTTPSSSAQYHTVQHGAACPAPSWLGMWCAEGNRHGTQYADCTRCARSPVLAQMWAGASAVLVQMWAGASPVPGVDVRGATH